MNWKTEQSASWIAEKFALLKHTTMVDIRWVEKSEADEKIRDLETRIEALNLHYKTMERIAKDSSEEAHQLRTILNNTMRPQ